MSEFKLPDLPSDDELGIGDDDLEEFLEDEGSELTDAEMRALLGDSPKPKTPPSDEPPPPADGEPPKKKSKPKKEPVPEGPRTRWRGPVTLALLIFAAWLGSSSRAVPRPVPANAPDTVFSSARAMSHVVEIARAAHPPGSPEHDRVRAYLLDELRDLGLEPEVQTATSMIRRGSFVRGVTARNIVARIPGTDNTGAVLVTAHYDGRELAHAAGDDGSGVVSILESLRALRASAPLRNDLIILITDAEELGLLGARAFVDEHRWMDDVQAVISIEMRGGGGPSIMFETGAEYGWVLQAYKAGAPRPYANSLTYEIYQRMPNDTDFTPFREAGKQGLNFAAVGRAHVYHQVYDNPENLDEGTLQHHGLNALSMIRQFGNADLTAVNAPDVVYFSVPILGFVVYPEGWVWPVTAALLLLWLLVMALARRRGLRIWGVATGLAGSVVSMAALYGAGLWLNKWLGGFHPELGALHGSAFHSEGWYVLALTAFAVAVVTGIFGLARRKFSLVELATGASVVLMPLVAGVTYLVPLGAMNLQWPGLAFVTAVGLALLSSAGRLREVRWVLMVAAAFVVLALLTSMVELIWLAMSFRMASAFGVLIVVTLLLMLPALDALREPNAWWAPATAAVLCAAFVGVGIFHAKPSPERPLPSTLIYALDHETGEALWATQPSLGSDDPARAWAEDRTSVTFGESRSLEVFGPGTATYAVAAAPVVNAPPPTVTLAGDTVVDGVRTVRVAVRSTLSAELLIFRFPDGGAELVALNGKAIPTTQRGGEPAEETPSVVEHWGRPDNMVMLDLVVPVTDTAVTFELLEHSLRPGEFLGAGVFQRPPELAANIVRRSDRAMIRTPVFFALEPMTGITATPDTTAVAPTDTMPVLDSGTVGDTIGR